MLPSTPADYEALNEYLVEVRNRPFGWHVWDCLNFIDGAWLSCWGRPFAGVDVRERIVNGGMYKRRRELIETFGHTTVPDWLDTQAQRHCGVPVRGAAVLISSVIPTADRIIGASFGVCVGSHVATVGYSGVAYVPSDTFDEYWTPT